MASRNRAEHVQPGDILMVVHEFIARSPDELSLKRGDRIELIERDDDFGDGWYLGKHLHDGTTGLFPEVYTVPAPRPTLPSGSSARADQPTLHMKKSSTEPLPQPTVQINQATPKQPSPSDMSEASSTTNPSSPEPPAPLQPSSNIVNRTLAPPGKPRSMSMTLGADVGSPVMAEALSVIDEHMSDMNTPRQSLLNHDRRAANDSGSEYSSQRRLSYINGSETDEEETPVHTEAEVMAWTPAQVAEYLEDAGVQKKHCDIFREQEINGEALLGMDQTTIFLKEFELGPVGPRLRTWLKIKSLQQEVKTGTSARRTSQLAAEESAGEVTARTRSPSLGTVLPRIPSLRDGASGSRTPSRQGTQRIASTPLQNAVPQPDATSPFEPAVPFGAGPPSAGFSHSKRPSAASVRSLNQNRRHSSIDVTADALNHPSSPRPSHSKQPSFDRHWTMSTAAPKSADTTGSLSRFDTDDSSRELHSSHTFDTLDRGYFSGNEVENRKARNVLRKRDSPAHSRTPSYNTDTARRATTRRHSRFGSADTHRESIHVSPAARAYYNQSSRGILSTDSLAGSLNKPYNSKDSPPTVTKLDFAHSPSIDAIAASPNVAGSDTSSMDRPSPSPATVSHSFFSKKSSRVTGLRAISDAITGNEKALAVSGADTPHSPAKESPMASPARTGSSTPSGASKSFELDDEKGKFSASATSSSTGTKAAPPPRRRNKKATSAYLRGLEQKTPQEQILGCDYSGWMKKKSSNIMTTWKTRLFVLRGRRLSYYYSENDTEEKGLIDISNHRVLPANNELATNLHATLTGATSSPTSPQNASIPTSASTDEKNPSTARDGRNDAKGMFIFKLVPPRSGLPKGVNFTKPAVHYFAVDNIVQGRLWMAALIKATIDRDPDGEYTSSYAHKTISLAKARGMKPKPYFIKDEEDEKAKREKGEGGTEDDDTGLGIGGLGNGNDDKKVDSAMGEAPSPTTTA